MSTPQYKFAYFNLRGGGEPIRYLLSYLGIDFEDKRYEFGSEEWKKDKPIYPWGVLPVLIVNDKLKLSQSSAIIAYLGRKHNCEGSNEFESGQCMEYTCAVMDLYVETYPLHMEKDEEKRVEMVREFQTGSLAKFLDKISHDLEANGGKYLVGKGITYADFVVANGFEQMEAIMKKSDVLDKYPKLAEYSETIFNIPQIKKWIEKRPKTEF